MAITLWARIAPRQTMILKTTFYAPVIALREINPASSTLLLPQAGRLQPLSLITEGMWRLRAIFCVSKEAV
jgi:hypothetical protein